MIRRIAKWAINRLPAKMRDEIYAARRLKQELQDVRHLSPGNAHPQTIITLTTHGKRKTQSTPYAIVTLLKQTEPPDRIILWLGTGSKIPRCLKILQRYGVELKLREDIGSHTKFFYAFSEFPDDIMVTADDDIWYPPEWLARLKAGHRKNPAAIVCHRLHEIQISEKGTVEPYQNWRMCVSRSAFPNRLFPTTGGGALYPPGSLDARVLDLQLLESLTPGNDDPWLWAMARLRKTTFMIADDNIADIAEHALSNDEVGIYVRNLEGGENNIWMQRLFDAFPELLEDVLKGS